MELYVVNRSLPHDTTVNALMCKLTRIRNFARRSAKLSVSNGPGQTRFRLFLNFTEQRIETAGCQVILDLPIPHFFTIIFEPFRQLFQIFGNCVIAVSNSTILIMFEVYL